MPIITHALNRGVEKRTIFLEDRDYLRFIHDLYEFNDEDPVHIPPYFSPESCDVGRRKIRKPLVDILAFCLMPNHYHLMLSPRAKNGIPLFIKKLNGGYAKYFNEKYKRVGALFGGRYKRIDVTDEAHFIHLPYYIHCNPLDLINTDWRTGDIANPENALELLASYRWSSHLDYLGKRNFPSVTERNFLSEFFGGTDGYRQKIEGWIYSMRSEYIDPRIRLD